MGSPRRTKPFRRSAASILVTAAMLTSVGGADVLGRFTLASAHTERSSGLVNTYVATEPLVSFGQQVEPRVVLRPLRDRGTKVDAKGKNLWAVSRTGSFDVPSAALRAYKTAASTLRNADPSCQIPWTLLAGIGRVESDHGRYGGSVLGSDGLPRPAIRGIALNGVGPVAAIHDTDNGRFDGDKVWDRAVGPMQFIPSTWQYSGRDGDRDGIANPNDIDDAALAAAAYLCPAGGTQGGVAVWRAQVFRYNHSDYYVDLVMAFEKGYRTGSFVIPSPPPPPAPVEPAGGKGAGGKADGHHPQHPVSPPQPAPTGGPKGPHQGPKNSGPKGPGGSGGSGGPAGPGGSGGSGGSGGGSGGSGGGSGGSGGGPTPPPPSPTPSPTPTPPPPPEYTEATGALAACSGGWCVGGQKLDFGSGSQQAGSDFDGDGAVESNQDELTGLTGATVKVKYKTATGLVVELQGKSY